MRRYTIATALLLSGLSGLAPAQPTSPQRGAPPPPSQPSRSPAAASGRQAPRALFNVMEASITDLQQAMATGRVTAAQLVDSYLARIAAYDHRGPALNTMIRLNPRARADAAALDAERRSGRVRGPMHGIPIVLKDNYDTRDIPTTGGSIALVNHQPTRDAFVVQKLRQAGAVILGKTNLHELAAGITSISSLGGQTLNAYNPDRCPGGSSGGTASAVAANFAAIGWGTDTCGSIRIPAAFASLVGLRPTQGLYSRDGIIPLSLTQDTPGPLARTVRDLAIGLDVTAGADPNDPQTQLGAAAPPQRFQESLKTDALRGARIGIFRPYFRNVEGDIADTVRAAAMAMRALGAEVVEVNMPDFDDAIAGSRAIILETKFDLVDYFARTGESPVRSLREIIDRGLFDRQLENRHKDADTATARGSAAHRAVLARQAQLRARMIAFLDSLKLDAIAYPTIGQRPVLVGSPQTASSCALSAQSGLPAISIPAGFTSDGLPTGLELMGRPFSDARLVGFAFAFEQAGARRRAPAGAPALVAGGSPRVLPWGVDVGTPLTGARADFIFVPATSDLIVNAKSTGAQAGRVQAVVLRRWDGAPETKSSARRVTHRVLGPGMARGSTTLRLLGDDLAAFRQGRLTVAVFGDVGAEPLGEVVVRAPR